MSALDTPTHARRVNGRLAEALSPAPAPGAERGVTPANASPTAPVVPENAPFNPAQRDWLNGFLSGITVVARAAHNGDHATRTDAPAVPLAVLYGSQSGNCEALARDLRKYARSRGFEPTVTELDSFDRDQLHEASRLLIVTSTFGEGDPPDNARKFYDWLHSETAPSLASVSYAVCGLGDSSYTFFNKCAADIDTRLEALGATRLVDCAACDVAFEDDYAAWRETVFASPSMTAAAGPSPVGPTADAEDEDADDRPRFDKHNPYFAPVHHVEKLSGEGSAKEVNHVEILLAGSDLAYEVGDALGVWPVNDPALVEEILVITGITGTDRVMLRDQMCPIRLALQTKLDIITLTQATIDALGIEGSTEKVRGLHLIDALRQWEPVVSAQRLADALRPLQPRLYSIASSPLAHPGEVHLTVGAVRYELQGSRRKGVASTYLADRCGFGQRVGVYIHKAPHFHLTDNDDAPVIMCGPGTGIAPFRAFLEERQARGAAGKNWLFFGDQHEANDFLYREQLTSLQSDGTLDRLSLAWSRDSGQKVYVQDRMREAAAELFAWLEDGAYFYICGDASRMAGDVDTALRQIIAEHGGLSDAAVEDYMDTLVKEHRYQRDVY